MLTPALPVRGRFLPSGVPRVNWAHPITRGLRNVWAYIGTNVPYSLVNGTSLPLGSNLPTNGMTVAGGGFKYNGSNRLNYGTDTSLSGNNAFSLMVFLTPAAATASQRFFGVSNGSAANPYCYLGVSPTTANAFRIVCVDTASNSVSATEASGTLSVGAPVVVSGNAAYGSGTISLYVNGSLAATAAATASNNGTMNTTAFGGAFTGNAAGSYTNGTGHLAAEWDRQLTDIEHELLGQNPTCFLLYPEDDAAALMTGFSTSFGSGTATTTSIGSTIATVTVGTAVNGTAPYTYQWYRSTTSGFTPGAGNIISGATSQTLNDTGLTNGTTYYYKNVAADSASHTATSNETSATPQAVSANGVTFSSVTSSGVTVTTSTASGGTGPYSYQFQRAPDSSGSPGTFANVGTAGASLSLNDTGLSSSTKYWYRVVVTDALSATANGASSSTTTLAPSAVSAGTASLTSTGNGTVSVSSTASSGGVAGITYQWYRSTDASVDGSAVSGAVSLTLNDTGLTNGVPYYYKLVSTDGTTTAKTNQVSGVPAVPVYLGIISDSWGTTTCTSGSTSASVTASAAGNLVGNQLQALFQDGTQVVLSNQGIGGTNASQWVSGSSNLNAALAAFNSIRSTHSDWTILVHLGINDSSVNLSNPTGGETAAQYKAYVQNIVTYLTDTWGAGLVVLIGPPNIKDISANHTPTGVALLAQYFPALQQIAAANPTKVFATQSEFNFFTNNQQFLGGDKVHPTPPDANGQGGSVYVAGLWAKAVYDARNPAAAATARGPIFYRLGL